MVIVLGQLPPDNCCPGHLPPRIIAHHQAIPPDNCPQIIAPGQLPPRQMDPLDRWPPGLLLPRIIAPRVIALPPRQWSPEKLLWTIGAWIIFTTG